MNPVAINWHLQLLLGYCDSSDPQYSYETILLSFVSVVFLLLQVVVVFLKIRTILVYVSGILATSFQSSNQESPA